VIYSNHLVIVTNLIF